MLDTFAKITDPLPAGHIIDVPLRESSSPLSRTSTSSDALGSEPWWLCEEIGDIARLLELSTLVQEQPTLMPLRGSRAPKLGLRRNSQLPGARERLELMQRLSVSLKLTRLLGLNDGLG